MNEAFVGMTIEEKRMRRLVQQAHGLVEEALALMEDTDYAESLESALDAMEEVL